MVTPLQKLPGNYLVPRDNTINAKTILSLGKHFIEIMHKVG